MAWSPCSTNQKYQLCMHFPTILALQMMNVVREVLFGGRGKVEGMQERMDVTDRKINDLLQYIDVALNNVRRVSESLLKSEYKH